MKHILVGIAALTFAAAASATYCGSNTLHPGAGAPVWPDHCNDAPAPPSTPTTPTNTLTGDQRQQQGQAQGQLQRQQQAANADASAKAAAAAAARSSSRSQANGNGVNAGAGAGANAGYGAGAGAGSNNAASQTTTVNTGGAAGSGDTYTSLALGMPSVPPTPPSIVAGAVLSTSAMGCGPAQRVVAESVYGTYRGMFSDSREYLGNTEHTEPYMDENGTVVPYIRIGDHWFGHQVIYTSGALSVSAGSNISVGGWGSSGAGGNGGGGVSGAMQRIVTTVQLRLCDVGPVVAAAPAVFVPTAPVARVAHRKPAPRRKPIAVAATPDPACMASATQSCKAKAFTPVALGKN